MPTVLLAPALALVVLAPLAVLLVHLLRGSRRRVRVPALFLWRDLPPGLSGRDRWRMPPLTALLLLQLLAAGLIAFALARPATALDPPRHLALVLDASASMQATDVGPSRFEVARARALERLDALAAADRVSVVRAGSNARLVASGTPGEIRAELAALPAGAGAGALGEAVMLASQELAHTAPTHQGQMLVFTDGATSAPATLATLPAPAEVVPVTGGVGASDNQGLVRVEVRSALGGRGQEAYVEVANYAERAVRATLRTLATETGLEIDSRGVDLAPRTTTRVLVGLPPDVARLTFSLSTGNGRDALTLDDTVEVTAPAPGAPPRRVALVAREPRALQHALEAIPSVQVQVVDPTAGGVNQTGGAGAPQAAPAGGASPVGDSTATEAGSTDGDRSTLESVDLVVYDGVLPPRLPGRPLLIVNPPEGNPHLDVRGAFRSGTPTVVAPGHPLLADVDLASLRLDRAARLAAPAWARAVLTSGDTPLILEGRHEAQSVVVFAFDPFRSGLEKSIAFPLLVSNAVTYLLAGASGVSVSPGQVVTLPAPGNGAGTAVLVRPDGRHEVLTPEGSALRVTNTDQVGRYLVLDASVAPQAATSAGNRAAALPASPALEPGGAVARSLSADGALLGAFAVNLLDVAESDIRPRRDLEAWLASVPVLAAPPPVEAGVAEWWRPLLFAGLAALGLEWLLFARRG